MRTVLFINLHSRQARNNIELVKKRLAKSKRFDVVETITVKQAGKLDKPLERLMKLKDIDCVLVGSGDGTIDAVLNTLRDRKDIVYGFLPLGTGNSFVRSLYMSVDVEEAINQLEHAKPKPISLGEVNGHLFANMAGIGLSVSVSLNISDITKRFFGNMAYVLSGFKNLITHKAMLVTMTADGNEYSFFTHHIVVSNGRYHGHLPVSKEASVYKDKLVLVAFGVRSSRIHYAYSMLLFELGLHKKARHIKLIPFKETVLDVTPMRPVEIDGEIVTNTPLKLRVVPKAIKVLS